jgi:hypothetical protein
MTQALDSRFPVSSDDPRLKRGVCTRFRVVAADIISLRDQSQDRQDRWAAANRALDALEVARELTLKALRTTT